MKNAPSMLAKKLSNPNLFENIQPQNLCSTDYNQESNFNLCNGKNPISIAQDNYEKFK